jgi:hypothetical protein
MSALLLVIRLRTLNLLVQNTLFCRHPDKTSAALRCSTGSGHGPPATAYALRYLILKYSVVLRIGTEGTQIFRSMTMPL